MEADEHVYTALCWSFGGATTAEVLGTQNSFCLDVVKLTVDFEL